jgi:hypothetical protein
MTPDPTNSTAISVARVIELDVPRSWQEAVAVIMEAGDVARQAGSKLSAEGCVISTIGDLHLESVPGARLLAPEVALPSVLAELLEGQAAPEALRTLVTSSQDSPQGIDAVMTGLAYFERPQRRADIAALATRAVAAEADARADSELNRLRRTTPGRASTTAAAPESSTRMRLGKRAIGTLVAAGAWFLVGVAVTGWYLSRPAQPAPDPVDSVARGSTAAEGAAPAEAPPPSGVGGLMSAASEALNSAATAGLRAIGLAAPADDSAKPPGPPPSAARPASGRTRAGSASATPPAAVPAVPTVPAPVPMAPTPAELVPVAAEPAGAMSAPSPKPAFFSGSDADVEPPVLVYPQLPEPPSSSFAPGQAYFEILVNEGGTVERVRLMAAQARFQDRMLVSAAKAWRFKPATKDGESVRYLLRVPTTQSSPESR